MIGSWAVPRKLISREGRRWNSTRERASEKQYSLRRWWVVVVVQLGLYGQKKRWGGEGEEPCIMPLRYRVQLWLSRFVYNACLLHKLAMLIMLLAASTTNADRPDRANDGRTAGLNSLWSRLSRIIPLRIELELTCLGRYFSLFFLWGVRMLREHCFCSVGCWCMELTCVLYWYEDGLK